MKKPSKWEKNEANRRLKAKGWTLVDFLEQGIPVADVDGYIDLIKSLHRKEGRFPDGSKGKLEKNLVSKLNAYSNPKSNTYRPAFAKWLKSKEYLSRKDLYKKDIEDKISDVKNFWKVNKRLPKNGIIDELRLRKILYSYCSVLHTGYKKDFHIWAKSKGYGQSKWTYEKCKKEALKHKTRSAWKKAPGFSYYTAINNGWLERLCIHMTTTQVVHGTWTVKKNCINEAKKYKTIKEWVQKSSGSYSAASEYGWIKECQKHMTNLRPVRKITNETGVIYSSIAEAARETKTLGPNILKVLRGKRSQTGGFHWKYVK